MENEHEILFIRDTTTKFEFCVRVGDLRCIFSLCDKWADSPRRSQEQYMYGNQIKQLIKSYNINNIEGQSFYWSAYRIYLLREEVVAVLVQRDMFTFLDHVKRLWDNFEERVCLNDNNEHID
jgi:hypothetical protein